MHVRPKWSLPGVLKWLFYPGEATLKHFCYLRPGIFPVTPQNTQNEMSVCWHIFEVTQVACRLHWCGKKRIQVSGLINDLVWAGCICQNSNEHFSRIGGISDTDSRTILNLVTHFKQVGTGQCFPCLITIFFPTFYNLMETSKI